MPLYRKTRNYSKGDHVLTTEWSRNYGKVGSYLIIREYIGPSNMVEGAVLLHFLAEVKYRLYSDGSYTFKGIQMKNSGGRLSIPVLVPQKNLVGVVPKDIDVTDSYAVKKYAKQVMKYHASKLFSSYQKWAQMQREYEDTNDKE